MSSPLLKCIPQLIRDKYAKNKSESTIAPMAAFPGKLSKLEPKETQVQNSQSAQDVLFWKIPIVLSLSTVTSEIFLLAYPV